MFIKLTRPKSRTYAQLVQSFRDEQGQPRQRTVVTLGRSGVDITTPQVRFESALALGDVWALDQLWRELGFDALAAVFRRARYTTPIEQAIRVMVFNRLCDADSKLGTLRWLQTVSMAGVDADKLSHQQLLRSMDALMDHQGAVNDTVAHLLRPLIDEELSVVFYELTTIRAEGLSEQGGDVRRFGMSKQGLIARQFMLGVPGRRYGEFAEVLQTMQAKMASASSEVIDETRWGEHRLVIAHDPITALEQSAQRQGKIDALHARAAELAGKLDAQDDGVVRRGRKLCDSGAKARFFHEVSDAHLSRIIKVDLQSDVFTYEVDAQALQRAALMDGKLMLVTNVADLSAAEIVQRYKALADIERGFKVLKSEIEIAPVLHRLPERIKAHASICFMALILYRVMRQRLKLADTGLSPEAALSNLRRIQRHSVSIDNGAPVSGISTINQDQVAIMAALKVKKLSAEPQLPLL